MPLSTASNSRLNSIASVSQMARLVGLSRAQFHYHVRNGAFLPPVYCVASRRPFYTQAMQLRNIRVREEQVGIDGRYVLFYEQRQSPNEVRSALRNNTGAARTSRVRHEGLIEGLRGLGLSNVTGDLVAAAVRECFPNGTADVEHGELLRAVYRHLRRSGVA